MIPGDTLNRIKEAHKGPRSVEIGAGVHTGAAVLCRGSESVYDPRSALSLDLNHHPVVLASPGNRADLATGIVLDRKPTAEAVMPLGLVHGVTRTEQPGDRQGSIQL
jgi:hypothetical protein